MLTRITDKCYWCSLIPQKISLNSCVNLSYSGKSDSHKPGEIIIEANKKKTSLNEISQSRSIQILLRKLWHLKKEKQETHTFSFHFNFVTLSFTIINSYTENN